MSRISFFKRGIVSIGITLLIARGAWKGTERIFVQYQRDPNFDQNLDQFFPLLIFLGVIGAMYLMTRGSDPLWIQKLRGWLIEVGSIGSISICVSIFTGINVRIVLGTVLILVCGVWMAFGRWSVLRWIGKLIVGVYLTIALRILIPTYPQKIELGQFLLSSPIEIRTFAPGQTQESASSSTELILYSGTNKSSFSLESTRPTYRFPINVLPTTLVYASSDPLRDQRVHFVWRDGTIITLFPQSTIEATSTGTKPSDMRLIITPKAGKILIHSPRSQRIFSGHIIRLGEEEKQCFNLQSENTQGKRAYSCDTQITGDQTKLQSLHILAKEEIENIQQAFWSERKQRFHDRYGRIPGDIKALIPVLESKATRGSFIFPSVYHTSRENFQIYTTIQRTAEPKELSQEVRNLISNLLQK